MNEYVDVLLRAVIAILLLLLVAKLLGKQTVSNMTFLDFVTGITLGAIAGNLAFNVQIKSLHMVLALVVMAGTSLLLSVIALKSRRMRNWISGSPTVLIEGGRVLEDNMRKIRYSLDSLDQALREQSIFNIGEVEYAVLEDNGVLSVLKKDDFQAATRKDLKLKAKPQSFPVELVMDGALVEGNLEANGLTREWLERELGRRGKRLEDVFYAVRGTHGQLFVDGYEDRIRRPVDKE
ncbi:Uncharacterized membrane protein YcaP, DUF421 family [Paenibacillus sp. UNC496MF]|uniref:DUF421 domain-containing protein n=1 Tax=Paenibacillus sp. UNC496MF TaxID=1502753 RepID=UPI0008E10FCE|nr:DUF421 domain-containing protein [Paenibacillus sp. UNC496MF]SFJ21626.1 Uncharacterized membrane protein YcaP, DUF421 family [Paenibacillus sp. UNC496MF]